MKRLMLLMLFALLACGWVMAQEAIVGNTAYLTTIDVMGAHENGGRGCAGCHAPHSGGRGSGGEIIGTGASYTGAGTAEGDTGLWGTDLNPLATGYPSGITFDSQYPTGALPTTFTNGVGMSTGLATCLSCHDGNMSKGAMMSGIAYEQAWGLLNFATTAGSNGNVGAVKLYGPNQIPTLLGNDGGVAGDYSNDHPCGPLANLGAVFGTYLANALTLNGTTIGAVTNSPYANFVSGYGMPAVSSTVSGGAGLGSYYVVCTTCHNQHIQNIYSGTAGSVSGTFAKIFYVNGPYNPAAPYTPKYEPSTMRFCQQCHFSFSSEYSGSGTSVGTAF